MSYAPTDGPEERMAESIEQAEQDMWELDLAEQLADESRDDLELA